MSTSEELDHDLGNFDLLPGVTFHYSFWSKAAAYSQAEAHCQESLHGHLVSILSKEELQFLENGLKKVDPVPTAVWIGEKCRFTIDMILHYLTCLYDIHYSEDNYD